MIKQSPGIIPGNRPFYLGKFFSQDIARLSDNSRVYTNASIENTLNYEKSIGKHSVERFIGTVLQGERQGFKRKQCTRIYNAVLSCY